MSERRLIERAQHRLGCLVGAVGGVIVALLEALLGDLDTVGTNLRLCPRQAQQVDQLGGRTIPL